MKSTIKCSVVLSAYNCEKYIADAIESIINQTYTNFELIIIDDRSTDGTYQILTEFKKRDTRIKLFRNHQNKGLPYSLNRGISKSRGKYIVRMDGDDIAFSNRLKKQIYYMEENPDIFLSGSGAIVVNSDGKFIRKYKPLRTNITTASLLEKNQLFHPSIIFRNDGTVIYREKFTYAQDYDLYLRLSMKGLKITNLLEPLIYYRSYYTEDRPIKIAKQYIFSKEAVKSFRQLVNGRPDSYKEMSEQLISECTFDILQDKNVGEILILENLKSNSYKNATKIFLKYYQQFGIDFRIAIIIVKNLFSVPYRIARSIYYSIIYSKPIKDQKLPI